MDVYSSGSSDVLLSQYEGLPSLDAQKMVKYTFSFPVNAAFDSIGNHIISFRYITANSESITLENYDSTTEELYDDSMLLNYTVTADLHLSDVKNPVGSGHLKYGNKVSFSFKVQDSISGKYIYPGSDTSTVYLLLSHKDKRDKIYSSARSAALLVEDAKDSSKRFQIDWIVNPNAIKGKGFLELVAQISSDKTLPLLVDKGKNPWKAEVEIGGEITYENDIYASEMDEVYTVFRVKFTLACQGDLLTGANLIAFISVKENDKETELLSLPVTYGDKPGSYQVSWKLEKKNTVTGTYIVNFYREVDVNRRKEGISSDPFFTISIEHEKKADEGGVFPTEFIVLLLFVASYGYLSWIKMEIEDTRVKKVKK